MVMKRFFKSKILRDEKKGTRKKREATKEDDDNSGQKHGPPVACVIGHRYVCKQAKTADSV